MLRYSQTIKVYQARKFLIEYPLPPDGVKNKVFTPPGMPAPKYKPKDRHRPTEQEEKKLRALGEEVDAYLNFALNQKGRQKHTIIRQLLGLSKKVTPSLFIKTISRALKYKITDISCIERIALLLMTNSEGELPRVEIDEQFQDRPAYREGCESSEVDLTIYDKMLEDESK